MNQDLSLQEVKKEWHGSLKSYVIGFIISLLLTSASFLIVVFKVLAGQTLIFALVFLALVQSICQLLFFLHLGQEAKPRWETMIFFFMFIILLIIVGGSLWIMQDLNDRVMMDMSSMNAEKTDD
ncbi:MAG: cytochrome o ubiquinol oxidase subunit IV [Parachlamydiaceae bacterium]|nr:cytochrome o ubiquinol oxidase subunit IV [Parachlamydiaceae bacterium]